MAELTPSTREAARRLGVSDTTMHKAEGRSRVPRLLPRGCLAEGLGAGVSNEASLPIIPQVRKLIMTKNIRHGGLQIAMDSVLMRLRMTENWCVPGNQFGRTGLTF
jgi:hypothetical protein